MPELGDLRLLDQDGALIQLLDDELVVEGAVDINQHGLDGRVALDENAWAALLAGRACKAGRRRTSNSLDHGGGCREDAAGVLAADTESEANGAG